MTSSGSGQATRDGVPARPTVGIVDDHGLVLDGLADWIRRNALDLDLVLTATSWVEFARAEAFPPDVVIMDLQLKEPISVEARIRICRSVDASVVVMSALDAPETVTRVLEAGAAAFVAKEQPAAELVETVRRVIGVGVTPARGWDEPVPSPRVAATSIRFSDDEEETLRLYASGHSPVEVAMILGTNIQAVKNHLDRVREQYSSEGRLADKKHDLVLRAAEDGYLA